MGADRKISEAGPSYSTFYPTGGVSVSKGGQGIFVDPKLDEPLEIWVDTDLQGRASLIKAIEVSLHRPTAL